MSRNRFSSIEITNIDEYQRQLSLFENEINQLKREKSFLIDEMKRKFKLCQNCLKNNYAQIIKIGSNCQECKEELGQTCQ